MSESTSVNQLQGQASDVFNKAADQFSEHASQLQDMANDVRYRSEDFIQSNPWLAVAIAASIGFAVGASLVFVRR